MPRTTSWQQIRREIALTDAQIAAYVRLEEAEDRLAEAVGADGEEGWWPEAVDERYLFALARGVASAGGRLELRAVFEDREVVLLSEPDPQRARFHPDGG